MHLEHDVQARVRRMSDHSFRETLGCIFVGDLTNYKAVESGNLISIQCDIGV